MRRDEAPSGSRQPYSEEAERSVLGSCVLDPDRVIDLCVARKITPRRITGANAQQQREITRAIRRARNMGMLA